MTRSGAGGMRGKRAVTVVFGAVYHGDVMRHTALRLYQPSNRPGRDWVIDVGKSSSGQRTREPSTTTWPRSPNLVAGGEAPAVTQYRRPYSRRLTNSVENG